MEEVNFILRVIKFILLLFVIFVICYFCCFGKEYIINWFDDIARKGRSNFLNQAIQLLSQQRYSTRSELCQYYYIHNNSTVGHVGRRVGPK
jgi:hypothetical protein